MSYEEEDTCSSCQYSDCEGKAWLVSKESSRSIADIKRD